MALNRSETLALEQIRATDRTTHAIRALTIFILYEVAYGVGVAVLVGLALGPTLSLEEPYWALLVIAGLLAITGLIHSLVVAFGELRSSQVGRQFSLPVEDKSEPSKRRRRNKVEDPQEEKISEFEARAREAQDPYRRLYGVD